MNIDQALAVLEAVDSGEVVASMTNRDTWETHPEYLLDNGWRIRVFDDCGEWDYVDDIASVGDDWIGLWSYLDVIGVPAPTDGLDLVREWRPQHLERWHWCVDGASPSGYTCEES